MARRYAQGLRAGSGPDNHALPPNSMLYHCWQAAPPHDPVTKAARGDHPSGVNARFGDGLVVFLKDATRLLTRRALASRAGGAAASADS